MGRSRPGTPRGPRGTIGCRRSCSIGEGITPGSSHRARPSVGHKSRRREVGPSDGAGSPRRDELTRRPTMVVSPMRGSSVPNAPPSSASTPCRASSSGTRLVSIRTLSWRSSSRRHEPSSFRVKIAICRTNRSGVGRDTSVTRAQSSPTHPRLARSVRSVPQVRSQMLSASTPPGRAPPHSPRAHGRSLRRPGGS